MAKLHAPTSFGTANILDFTRGQDKIDLTSLAQAASLSDLVISASGGDVTIDLGAGDSLVLTSFSGQLDAGDFLF